MADSPELSWELIRKKNYVERLKFEKQPLDLAGELPELTARGYEDVSEEDIVRLQWFGLYHDKPKVGRFMLRVKTPGGILTPAELRTISEVSRQYGGSYGELTTRQNIQLHSLEFGALPEILDVLRAGGLTTLGACGDAVRNVTGCPVSGLAKDELFDTRPIVAEVARFFTGNREYSDLPRKHKITISACPHQCNAPEIHCVALSGLLRDGEPGFSLRVGGGLSTWPRISDDLGVFVPLADTLPVLRAILDLWKEDLESRRSRAKARLKFMVDRVGPAGFRGRIEERLGAPLTDGAPAPPPAAEHDHIGIAPQRQEGLFLAGFPVFLGLANADQLAAIAEVAEGYGGGIRLTRRQNFILTDIPEKRLQEVVGRVEELGFRIDGGGLRASSIACTGEPFCNFSVAETKHKLAEIVEHLEATFGERVAGLRLNLDGCPHSCAHHWIGDIGLQGTTLRERGPAGERLRGYDLFLRGGLGANAAIGRPVFRRVSAEEVHQVIEKLLAGYFDRRQGEESVQQFFQRMSDQDLLSLGGFDVSQGVEADVAV
ncbi:MAG TPA: nitrite/sulfite reductase [Thermoanaerobaculia bacterium]|nr:nitrite/sulfite reductase [Thermoanaerobaculia bacterium]